MASGEPSPIGAGLAGRCPRCGQGRLFSGLLTPAKACTSCGLDFGFADSGDGPAVFGVLILGFIMVAGGVWMEFAYGPPLWVHAAIWLPFILGGSILVQRLGKGLFIALQYANRAGEGRREN
jgi:uncharacterized protein (DUF983 family)